MRKVSRWLIGVFVAITACAGVGPRDVVKERRDLVYRELSSTVALVEVEGEAPRPYCSGVWIGPSRILTAYHCVDGDIPPAIGDTVHVSDLSDVGKSDSGAQYFTDSHDAKITKLDFMHDLATLDCPSAHNHESSSIARGTITPGDPVGIVGHPGGLIFSWSPGTIAAARVLDSRGRSIKVWQITSNAWFGNSGGAAFDEIGNIVGICSMLGRGPLMTYFIHRDSIAALLQ